MIAVVTPPRARGAPPWWSVRERTIVVTRWLVALAARREPEPSSPAVPIGMVAGGNEPDPRVLLDQLYQAHARALLTYLAARLPSLADAEDALADVFLKAMRLTDAGDVPSVGWLFTVARRTVADFYRERSRTLAHEEALAEAEELTPAEGHAEPERAALRAEERRELRILIAQLPDEQRDALALRFAGGLRSAEIAAILGKSDEATRAMLSRAVRRLREEWVR